MELADLVYVAVIIAFFALAAVLVAACDRIIGPDELAGTRGTAGTAGTEPEAERLPV
jgi:hypothetical protein